MDGIIDSVDLSLSKLWESKLWETVKERGPWHAAAHEGLKESDMT